MSVCWEFKKEKEETGVCSFSKRSEDIECGICGGNTCDRPRTSVFPC